MKLCWPSRTVAGTSLSGSWRYQEGMWRRMRWMRWWPQENGRSLMRTCWMMPGSHGHNYLRLNSATRYEKSYYMTKLIFWMQYLCFEKHVEAISLERTFVLSYMYVVVFWKDFGGFRVDFCITCSKMQKIRFEGYFFAFCLCFNIC